MSPTVSLVAPSLAATHAVAGALATCCRAGDIVVLAGEMGAGKTAFAQGFGKALGVAEPITSPTFTLVQSYATPRGQFHHADVYRLEQLHEVADLALGELAEFRGIVVVEWGDVVSAVLGDHLEVHLELVADPIADDGTATDEARRITITASGRAWAERWQLLTDRLGALDLGAAH
ncbi:MAG: tRNA (adenosine(37)-N6)-threonylcarbamoyltransferase complex ATPase subunit type 1 TsaE [Ilumatobacteraceae bacterium]